MLGFVCAPPGAGQSRSEEERIGPTAPTSLGKALEILDLFSLNAPLVRVEAIERRLGYTRSTAYRYLKELCDVGLLAPLSGGVYSLGPRIMELERLLELTDPLYTAGRTVLSAGRSRRNVYLLHSLYRDRVLCIFKAGPDALVYRGRKVVVRRARGLPFPLYQGAASLALFAHMSSHRIRQIWLKDAERIERAGLGATLEELKTTLATIRRQGYATSHGQITPLLAGVAVPIFRPDDGRLVGSLAQTFTADTIDDLAIARSAARLTRMGQEIGALYVKAAGSRGT